MKDVRWVVFMLVMAMPARMAVGQDRALAGGIGYGGPLGAAVTGELLHGLRVDVSEEGERVGGRAGLLVQVHAGSGGGKLSVGVGGRAGIESDDFTGAFAAALKLSLARTWGSPVGTRPGLTYLGPELDLSAMHVGLTLGPLFRVGGEGGPAVLFALGLGVRF